MTMRPQFGSPPWTAVFTSGELTIFLAVIFASFADESRRTVHSMSFVAPSDCATMSRASLIDMHRTASTQSARASPATGTARVEKIATVSLVLVSVSTLRLLNVRSTASTRTALRPGRHRRRRRS